MEIEFEIVTTIPPIWEEAHKHFEIDDEFTVYTYGNKLHNPARLRLPTETIEHEKVHMIQQSKTEGGPAEWWKKYFADPEFRFLQECEAYGRQYAFYCREKKDRNARARYLWELARVLTSPMYKVEKDHSDARQRIEFIGNAHLKTL